LIDKPEAKLLACLFLGFFVALPHAFLDISSIFGQKLELTVNFVERVFVLSGHWLMMRLSQL